MNVGTFNLPLGFILKLVLLYDVYRVRKSAICFLVKSNAHLMLERLLDFYLGILRGEKKKRQLFQNI